MGSTTKELDQRYIDVLKRLEWRICGYDDGSVEIENFSPAGEDLIISAGVKNFAKEIKERYENFDPDEHIEMWIEARRAGRSGIPPARELARDADKIDKMLEELANALAEVEKEFEREDIPAEEADDEI